MRRVEQLAGRLGVDAYALLGLVAVVSVSILIVTTYTGSLRSLFSGGAPEITAVFDDARTLTTGDPVRVHGVTVGEVKALEVLDGGRATKATLTVDKKAGAVYRDARAAIGWRTLLGGAFAVNIEPGRSESGELGSGTIPAEQTSTQVELDDVASVVQGQARSGLRSIPPELTRALGTEDTLPRLADALADVSPAVSEGLGALRGIEEHRDLRRLVHETSKVVRALDAPDDAMRKVVEGAAVTVRTTAAREADLRVTLRDAPGVMHDTNTTLTALDGTLELAEPVVRKLQDPAGDVAPTLARLRPVVTSADRLLGNARPLLRALRPAVSSLASTARQGLPLLDELDPSLDRLDEAILPYVNEKDKGTQRTTAQMVGPGLGGLGNVAAPIDPNGHVLRFPFSLGSSPAYLPCQIYAANPDKTRLVECRELQDILKTYLEWQPLGPAPGTAPDPADSGGKRR